jgi:hypothetical protein
MKRVVVLLPLWALVALLLLVGLRAVVVADEDDSQNPHLMVLEDGSPDTDKCGFCHNDDLTLARSKEETCTLCHTVAQHGGSMTHVNAKAAEVKRLVPESKAGEMDFPLTDAGGLYCGTCHLFHDPAGVVSGEKWLPAGCPESTAPLATAVRGALETYRDSIADAQAAHFVKEGTRALRLPACDGALCLHCHGDKR